ncbi:hypothetical protein Moror_6328 [Moniliophthora roreri MCA 2997]|uniref:DUF6533 domain-containing protein n=1 Tax=Moniliophthora roreri (strain MCA 2997) TaxID=1381753 RepID=V2XTM9_MONRO|nr:hypothetical protein Moror_6328 [Moniliophthora roreri MCA 2997]
MQVTRLVRDLNAAAGAALVFLVWDILITLDEEIEYIWSKPWTSWIKWSFLFARYFSLFTQICNRTIEWMVIYSVSLYGPSIRIWFGTQVMLAFLIMTGAEVVMMARGTFKWNYVVSLLSFQNSLCFVQQE